MGPDDPRAHRQWCNPQKLPRKVRLQKRRKKFGREKPSHTQKKQKRTVIFFPLLLLHQIITVASPNNYHQIDLPNNHQIEGFTSTTATLIIIIIICHRKRRRWWKNGRSRKNDRKKSEKKAWSSKMCDKPDLGCNWTSTIHSMKQF